MYNGLALMMLILWPFIQLFLIQVHVAPNFWRRLSVWTYLVIFMEGLPLAYTIKLWQDVIIQYQIRTNPPIFAFGVVKVIAGIVLHAWTAKLLGIKTTIGYTELKPKDETQNLITSGPFSVVRHPSYVAHTFILSGIFLITGVLAVGIMTLTDFLISYFITMELEERELIQRFGDQYRKYQMSIPKFFPKIRSQ